MSNPVRLLMLAVLLAALAPAAPARAAVTQSNVTAPTDGSFLRFATDNPQIALSGTSNGTAADTLDLYCTRGTGARFKADKIAAGVTVAADGSFSYNGSAGSAGRSACVLRALPAGTTPTSTTSFSAYAGPRVYLGGLFDSRITSGPNGSTLYDYYLYNSQAQGGMDFDSLGGCGLDDSFVYDPLSLAKSEPLFFCNAWLWYRDGVAPYGSRSELQIDGRNAYPPAAASYVFKGATDNPGLLGITYSPSFSPTTGDLTIDETDPVLFCPGNPFPATASNCASFQRAPVDVHRTITMNHLGRLVTISDSFSSRDGAAHAVDLLYEQDFNNSNSPAYRFPWREAGYNQHSLQDTFPGPGGRSPGSIFALAKIDAPDGDVTYPRGAITYSSPPDDVRFLGYPTDPNASWALRYKRSVPASGALTLAFAYSQAFQAAEVAQLAGESEAALTAVTAAGGTPSQGGGGTKGGGRGAFRGVVLRGRRVAVTRGRLALSLSCPERTVRACKGTATLYAPSSGNSGAKHGRRPTVFARARFTIAAGKNRRITMSLRRPARRALRTHRGRLSAVLAILARDGSGQRRTTTANVRLTVRRR